MGHQEVAARLASAAGHWLNVEGAGVAVSSSPLLPRHLLLLLLHLTPPAILIMLAGAPWWSRRSSPP